MTKIARHKILFLTGTRADFGKLKSLMKVVQNSTNYDLNIFATGMHMNSKYGYTVDEIIKSGFHNIYQFINHETIEHMDRTLAKTVEGFSHYVHECKPDLIIVHGDRVEALAGAIVGSMNNILVAHIEGGELSGTIDELIRHAVSKLSHIHFVANNNAKKRLIQLGENKECVFEIGSPDIDLMNPDNLPDLIDVKKHYNIPFKNFSIAMFHPITTEYKHIRLYAKAFVDSIKSCGDNFVVVYPNNDLGSSEILAEYERLKNNKKIKIFPSLRFESFLTLLKHSDYIIGNSSAGIREAPYYGTPTIDIGSRQLNRAESNIIINSSYDKKSILDSITLLKSKNMKFKPDDSNKLDYGDGKSDEKFLNILDSGIIWKISCQKQMQELKYAKN